MPTLRRRSGRTALTLSAPKGWKAPDPSPAPAAITTSAGKLGAKPSVEKVTAVQASARPVKRVP